MPLSKSVHLPHVPALVRHAPLERRPDIRTIQDLPGHRPVTTTMIDTHVLQYGARSGCSPLATQ